MSGLRQAALLLHGLSPSDREWMLSRLPNDGADDLRLLLDELQQLGMPADPALIRRAIEPQSAAPDAGVPNLRGIAAASADEIHPLLCNEPDRLIAVVLSSSAWPWREALLARLGPARAQRIHELTNGPAVGVALRRAVLQQLSSRVAAHGGRSTAPGARPLLHRLKQGWRAWTR